MRVILKPVLAAGLVSLLLVGPARGEVLVNFIHPDRFSDANSRGDFPIRPDSPALHGLRQALQQFGTRYLPADARLQVEILDLDLAGRYEPWRIEARDVRILRAVDPPRIRLRYTLEQPGQPATSGEETVTDMLYLSRPEMRFNRGNPLAIEKAVLADWFRRRFTSA
jgi:hypothetical protein